MVERLLILPEAVQDAREACQWYEGREVGLGEKFLQTVDACIGRIQQDPGLFPVVHKRYRRALTRRFPSAIFYRHEDDAIRVYSVFHCARDPDQWRSRLP